MYGTYIDAFSQFFPNIFADAPKIYLPAHVQIENTFIGLLGIDTNLNKQV